MEGKCGKGGRKTNYNLHVVWRVWRRVVGDAIWRGGFAVRGTRRAALARAMAWAAGCGCTVMYVPAAAWPGLGGCGCTVMYVPAAAWPDLGGWAWAAGALARAMAWAAGGAR